MTSNELTYKQHLSLMPKHCLVDRIQALSIIVFIVAALFVLMTFLFFLERHSRKCIESTYKSTVQMNIEEADSLHEMRLKYLGIEKLAEK